MKPQIAKFNEFPKQTLLVPRKPLKLTVQSMYINGSSIINKY